MNFHIAPSPSKTLISDMPGRLGYYESLPLKKGDKQEMGIYKGMFIKPFMSLKRQANLSK